MSTSARPVFVVGSPRSGTSILTWSLGQHPNLLPLEETNWFGKLSLHLASLYDLAATRGERAHLNTTKVSRSAFYQAFGNVIDHMVLSGRAAMEECCAEVARRSPEQVNDAFRISRCEEEPKRRWIDGTPEYSFYIPGLLRLFPSARFIHIVREVREVVHSMTHFSTLAGYQLVGSEAAGYDYWLRTVRACVAAEKAYGSETILRVRYSDLVANPSAELRRCLEFLGESDCLNCAECMNTRINSSKVPGAVLALATGAVGAGEADAPATGARLAVRQQAEALSDELRSPPREDWQRCPRSVAQLEREFDRRAAYLDRLDEEMQKMVLLLAGAERELMSRREATLYERVREVVRTTVPYDAAVAVVSRGDNELLNLEGRAAWHLPQGPAGSYAGYHPANGRSAIEAIEALRAKGANFLLFPPSTRWWLDHYTELREYLRGHAHVAKDDQNTCILFSFEDPCIEDSDGNRDAVVGGDAPASGGPGPGVPRRPETPVAGGDVCRIQRGLRADRGEAPTSPAQEDRTGSIT